MGHGAALDCRTDRSPAQGPAQPPGTYAVLEFSCRMGALGLPYRERVTLRYEEGGVWRLTGYQARPD